MQSGKLAINLRTSNARNPKTGLQQICDRLNDRYGAPEMVDRSIKQKSTSFPKLSNEDTTKLYEVADILSRVESVKEDTNYSLLLSYHDSSVGINPIVAKLKTGTSRKMDKSCSEVHHQTNCTLLSICGICTDIINTSKIKFNPCFTYDSTPTVTQPKI